MMREPAKSSKEAALGTSGAVGAAIESGDSAAVPPAPAAESAPVARRARRVAVVKLGSSTITDGEGRVDRAYLADLAHQVNRARKAGWDVLIVSSGSIPCGLEALGLPLSRPKDMPSVQAAASVGMRALLAAYDQVFSPYGILTSLVLLTRRDTADRNAYLHARDTIRRLIELGCVPIINENDTVSVEQIKFGDNDTLAALVACLADADRVVILSDIEGLFTANPQTHPEAKLIRRVDRITPAIMEGAQGAGSAVGSGGMITKLTSARVLGAAGIPLVICHGRAPDAVLAALDDEPLGTLFLPRERRHEIAPRKLWVALGDAVRGRLVIDEGASSAIVWRGKSLLSVGVRRVEGAFAAGEVVDVLDESGSVIARGMTRCDAQDVRAGKGVAIHRDDLVVFE